MKLQKIYIPKIKLTNFLEKKVTEPLKKILRTEVIPKISSALKTDTERICILNWPRPGYSSKRAKGQSYSFRPKSFKTPANCCLEHVLEFQQKKNIKTLANELIKINSNKRQLLSLDSPSVKPFGTSLLKISTNSLIVRENLRPLKVKSSVSNSPLSNGLRDSPFTNQNQQKSKDQSRKKYAQLTFKEIMEIESDEQDGRFRKSRMPKRRKTKTQTSYVNRI